MAFIEFPKWVTHDSGERKIVYSAEEEAALGDGWTVPDFVAPVKHADSPSFAEYPKWVGSVIVQSAEEESALLGTDTLDERAALIAQAEAEGVKIDKRWSDDKIRAALVTA